MRIPLDAPREQDCIRERGIAVGHSCAVEQPRDRTGGVFAAGGSQREFGRTGAARADADGEPVEQSGLGGAQDPGRDCACLQRRRVAGKDLQVGRMAHGPLAERA